MSFKEISTDSIRYWESKRVIYNLVLAIVYVATIAIVEIGTLKYLGALGTFRWVVGVCVLAFIANICFCIAYPVDLFIQSSDFRDKWRRIRWIFFVIGLILSVFLTVSWGLAFSAVGVASYA